MLNNIEAERVRNRFSKEVLADKMGISVKTYYNWINEDTDIPSSALLNLSAIFNTNIEYLLQGSKFALANGFCRTGRVDGEDI